MGRKKKTIDRKVPLEPRYGSREATKFISRMMIDGKRSISMRIFYDAMAILEKKSGEEALPAFKKVLDNVKPSFEVKSRRVGGTTYQVPVDIRESRREALAMRWLINAAKARSSRGMGERLGAEFVDAFNSVGAAYKKKEDTHKMAEANKAFSHYKW